MLGAASIRGVPALGLPKISSLVGFFIFIPTLSASPLWSTNANKVTPLDCKIFWSPLYCLVDGVIAGLVDDSFIYGRYHRHAPRPFPECKFASRAE